MLTQLALAVRQLQDRRFLTVWLIAAACAVAILVGVFFALEWALSQVDPARWPNWLAKAWGAVDGWLAAPLVLVSGWFLFPAIATAVMGALLDDVVDAVEARHYPSHKAPEPMGFGRGLGLGLKSAARLIGWNLLALPLYVLLLFTALGPVVLYLALNGYLLGRDYTEMVAIRHLGDSATPAFLKKDKLGLLTVGVGTSLLFLIPLAGLFAPLLGAAMATHATHQRLGHAPA
jgi:CysZ protein